MYIYIKESCEIVVYKKREGERVKSKFRPLFILLEFKLEKIVTDKFECFTSN